MKTSSVCTSYKVNLQIEMQYAFPDVYSLHSASAAHQDLSAFQQACCLHVTQTVLGHV